MRVTRRPLTLLLGVVLLSCPALVIVSPAHADPVASNGQLIVWGDSQYGRTKVPAMLAGKKITAASVGDMHALALTDDGTIVGWGNSTFGQLRFPSSLNGKKVTAISAGYIHSLALTDEGTVIAWGDDFHGAATVPPSLAGKTVTAIAAGGGHSLALTDDGTVTAWGDDASRQATVPASLAGKKVTAISAGANHSLALTDDGTVTAWGYDARAQATVPGSLAGKKVTAISAGGNHSLALIDDGTITAWGGQATVPASLAGKKVTAISAGTNHSLALTDDGTVTAWGSRNTYGETTVPTSLAGTKVTAIAAGFNFSLALVLPQIVTDVADDAASIVAGSAITFTPRVNGAVADTIDTWNATGPNLTTSIDPSTGAITASSTMTGRHQVTLTIPTRTGTGTGTDTDTLIYHLALTVTPAPVHALTQQGPSARAFGDAASFAFTGTDVHGNSTGDETSRVTLTSSNPSDIITGTTVTGGSLGARTLTAVHTPSNTKQVFELTIEARTFTTGPAVTIGGIVKVGEHLTADTGAVSPTPDSISWQWFANRIPISGATADTFTPTTAQRGLPLSVTATARRTGYTDATGTSAQTGAVASANAPSISLDVNKKNLRRGQSATVTWSSTDADAVSGSGAWSGPRLPSGQVVVQPGLGTSTWILTATNAQGTTTAQTSVTVTRQATQLKVTTSRKVVTGKKTRIKASGLDPREPFTVKLAGRLTRGTADARGTATATITVPASNRAGPRTMTVTGSEKDRTGRTTVTIARKLKITVAKKHVQASDPQKVTVTGLLPGEKITLTYQGRTITTKNARANARGVHTARFTVGLNWGTKTITARTPRTGTARTTFTVIRRTHDLSPRWR